jgi:hypothetical protein
MMRSVAVLSAFALAGCVHEKVLEPAAGAALAPGSRSVAETASAGVTIRVTGDSWHGNLRSLERRVTPVRVVIDNRSGKTLRVGYGDFRLSGASGAHYAAMPPLQAGGTPSADVPPPYSRLYPDPWAGPFGYEPPHDAAIYASVPQRLPMQDVLADALPEGVVRDGERVAGFIYFQSVTGSESAVEFEMNLSDASDGQAFGRVAIPFQTAQR